METVMETVMESQRYATVRVEEAEMQPPERPVLFSFS
jgi:hypothetical protein